MTGDRNLGSLILESERLASEGDWGPGALAVNRELAALAPGAAGVRYRLALCLEEAEQYEKALAEFEHALALSSTDGELTGKTQPWIDRLRARIDARASTSFHDTRARAFELRDQGRVEEALIWHERAADVARTKTERAAALASWAATLRPLRKLDLETELVDESISLDPSRKTNKVAYTVRVAVLVDRGNVESAVREANALLAENPGDPAVLNAAGRALHALARRTGDNSYRERAAACFAQAKHA